MKDALGTAPPRRDLDSETVSNLRKWFLDYVRTFEGGDPHVRWGITLKRKHSIRVVKEIHGIGQELNLGEGDLRLAEVVALLHDVGRFEQYARYRTFADTHSVDHAQLGARIIRESGILREWPDSLQELVVYAVLHHSLAQLPSNGATAPVFYSKLLRDADKLDILKLVTRYFLPSRNGRGAWVEPALPDTSRISEQVREDLRQQRIVSIEHVRNRNDLILFRLGWVYDINFRPTLLRIKEKGYVEKIRGCLPNSPEIEDIFEAVHSFINKSLQPSGTSMK